MGNEWNNSRTWLQMARYYSRRWNKTQVIRDKITTKYLRRVRKLAKSELHARNMFMRINQWVLVGVEYFDWAGVDLGVMDRKERKNTCDGLFYARANVRLYLKRSEGERGLISAKDCVLSGCTLRLFGKTRRTYVEEGD